MTVPRQIIAALAFATLLLGAGCGGSDRSPVAAETDESSYVEAQKLKNQGRYPEALAAFLRVMEQRGDQASAESQLEAGLIYLDRIKDPNEAIHYFKKYLELQPNASRASYVRGRVEVAKREFALSLRGPNPLDAVQPDLQEKVDRLQNENERLQLENEQLKAGMVPSAASAPVPLFRLPSMTAPPVLQTAPPPAPDLASPLSLAPAAPPAPVGSQSPFVTVAPRAPVRPVPAPLSKPTAPASASARRHTVAPGDTLYNIARKYGVKVEAISAANRDLLPTVKTPLRLGAELKIP